MSNSKQKHEAVYSTAFVAHGLLEPYNAVVGKFNDTWHVITGTQAYVAATGKLYIRGDGGWYNIYASSSYFFSGGLENLELDVTFAIDRWRQSGSSYNYGFMLKHSDPVISGTEGTYYTKKFFARSSEFFFKRPHIEARWNSSKTDDRLNIYKTSNLASTEDNTNKLYIYKMENFHFEMNLSNK